MALAFDTNQIFRGRMITSVHGAYLKCFQHVTGNAVYGSFHEVGTHGVPVTSTTNFQLAFSFNTT